MNLGVPLFLIGTGKLSPAGVTRKGLFPRVRANMGGEMVRAGKTAHTDATLERFLASMDSNVSCEFVRTGKATITTFHGASVGTFMHGRFARSVRITAWFHGHES